MTELRLDTGSLTSDWCFSFYATFQVVHEYFPSVPIETQKKTNINNPSFFSNIIFEIFTAEGRYNLYTADGKYIFKERESFDGRNILKVSM